MRGANIIIEYIEPCLENTAIEGSGVYYIFMCFSSTFMHIFISQYDLSKQRFDCLYEAFEVKVCYVNRPIRSSVASVVSDSFSSFIHVLHFKNFLN